MTISLCRLVVINTTFAYFVDSTTIYTSLYQLVIDDILHNVAWIILSIIQTGIAKPQKQTLLDGML